MTETREATTALLAERPNAESALRSILAADENGTWTFDDVDVDSGLFGEIVAADIVEKRDGGYRVNDPAAVRAALDGEKATASESATTAEVKSQSLSIPSLSNVSVNRTAALALVGALIFLTLVRLISISAVFRDGAIVLSANDPYFYRYLVETVAAETSGPFDFGALASLPQRVTAGEPLLIVMLWFWTELLGGDANASGVVLALYPAVFAVLTGALVYLATLRLTDDRRVALAAVLALALIPAHAYRTSLGFADHHAFDYFWLALTAAALVSLTVRSGRIRDAGTAFWSAVFGVAVAGQTLAWEAGPLLILPLGLIVVGWATTAVRAGRSPVRELGGVLGGLGLGAVLTAGTHVALGWHGSTVGFAPAGLFVGAAAVVGVAELASRQSWSVRALAGGEVVAGVVVFGILPFVVPQLGAELQSGMQFLFKAEGIVETQSLVSADQGSLVGPFLSFGLMILLGLPYAGWAVLRAVREYEPEWLATATYTWYFLALALIQLRFAGELSVFVAIFAGLGFVHLAAKIDAIRMPKPFAKAESGRRGRERANETVGLKRPERREAMSLLGLGLFAGSFSFVQIPVKTGQLLVSDGLYEAATWMREYSEEQGWEYPQNYVFSEWGWNRVYNYFVTGNSQSYGFAQQNYREFQLSSKPVDWYEKLRDRVGFIVMTKVAASPKSLQTRLYTHFGSETDTAGALSHYRVVYARDGHRVFTLVPGATIVGVRENAEKVTIETDVRINDTEFTYQNTVTPNPYGVYGATVPYEGTYQLPAGTVQVPSKAVTDGTKFVRHDRGGVFHFPFDVGEGDVAYSRVSTTIGRIVNAQWTDDGVKGAALQFDSSKPSYLETNVKVPQQFTFSFWVKPTELDIGQGNNYRELLTTPNELPIALEESGRITFRIPGVTNEFFTAGTAPINRWTHVALTYDGQTRRIFINGAQQATDDVDGGSVAFDSPLRFGSRSAEDSAHAFDGYLDEVRLFGRALPPETVRKLARSKSNRD
ncbi:LamG-like jellyroll fold domain-containing protein [Haloprofundus salinisoli]|uniref:LamG-like jellyroll fold domain-containing protein n=1 Tax=Haloprofundus salinisoli TaxID=2876193 RepID=UPI001CCB5CBC|nr:LamG-like jellyroll fold domain-containing protein [Haloprofundus salinisoli]